MATPALIRLAVVCLAIGVWEFFRGGGDEST